jgi:hypothetical protein
VSCPFRFVEKPDSRTVTLRLFRTDRIPWAVVTGPLIGPETGRFQPAIDRCITGLQDGFDLAIRIANTTDSELVVTGDPSLWQSRWGTLLAGTPTEPAQSCSIVALRPPPASAAGLHAR